MLTVDRIRSIRTKRVPVYLSTLSEEKIDHLKRCSIPKSGGKLPSELTMWPLEEYLRYQAPFFSFFHTLDAAKEGSVLEIDSGSGRALLDLKAEYPSIKAYGTSMNEHGSVENFWIVANHFNISVYCKQDHPSLPIILEAHPIQSENFSMLFKPETFDFIFSRQFLSQDKLTANESHIFIPRLLPLLKIGRPAMIHMLAGSFHQTSDNKYYPILRVWNIAGRDAEQPRVSVVLYQTLCRASSFCIAVLFKKCAPGAALHGALGGCIVPPAISHLLPPPDWLLPELARAAALAESQGGPAGGGAAGLRYAHASVANFVAALDGWERRGAVPAL